MKWLGLFILVSFVLVASCTLLRGPFPRWVHSMVQGSVIDALSGQPVKNATIAFVRSEFGGGETSTDEDGKYKLAPVSEMRWFSLPGDPYYRTIVRASAEGYVSVEHKTGHGTGDVVGTRPAPERFVNFLLNKASAGTAIETRPWDVKARIIDEPLHSTESAVGPFSSGESSAPTR